MTTISDERLTFTQAGEHGNCVISPENGQGPYFTLIGGGSDEEQNALAAKICDAVNALRAQGGVRVKALEWGALRYTDDYSFASDAATPIGTYIATDTGWFLQGRTGWIDASNMDAAKAAAQADYERRILSSLEASPAPVIEGVTDEDVERAMKAFALIAHDMTPQQYAADRAAADKTPISRRRLEKSLRAMRAALAAKVGQ